VNDKRRYFWAGILLAFLSASSANAGGLYLYELGNPDVGAGYTFLWSGDLDMDVDRGPLSGRVSGTYENTSMHFINLFLDWKF
jgi:hypothetical protein